MAKHTDETPEEEFEVEVGDEAQVDEEQSAEVEELTNDLKRVQAEFLNFKRRSEVEKKELLDFAKNRVVREFLAVRDNFDRELAGRPRDVDRKWAESIDAIRRQFDQALTTLGVERFESQGEPFNPHMHEAVVMEDGDGEHETVLEELQPGYKLGNQILRPAIVKVGRTGKPAKTGESDATEDNSSNEQ
jgi:molecular chaperone GrpE